MRPPINGTVNKHNVRIWGGENPRFILEKERNKSKVNKWYGLINSVDNSLFPNPLTLEISIETCLNYRNVYAVPQLNDFRSWVMFQQDGTPPHRFSNTKDFVNETYYKQRFIKILLSSFCYTITTVWSWHYWHLHRQHDTVTTEHLYAVTVLLLYVEGLYCFQIPVNFFKLAFKSYCYSYRISFFAKPFVQMDS